MWFYIILIIKFIDYPNECGHIDAPIDEECMLSIWHEEGCIEDGTHLPSGLVGSDRAIIDTMSVQYDISC